MKSPTYPPRSEDDRCCRPKASSGSNRSSSTGRLQADEIHRSGNLGVAHKPAPDVFGSQVLSAQQGYPEIDADHVVVDPAVVRIEGVGKAVAPVSALAEALLHFAQRRQAGFRREHQRTGSGAGYNGSIDGRIARRTAPRNVAFGAVAGSNSPDIFRIAGKLLCQVDAESA